MVCTLHTSVYSNLLGFWMLAHSYNDFLRRQWTCCTIGKLDCSPAYAPRRRCPGVAVRVLDASDGTPGVLRSALASALQPSSSVCLCSQNIVMSALRLLSTVSRSAPRALAAGRRGYAEAVSDKIKLSLVLPHQVRSARRTSHSAQY